MTWPRSAPRSRGGAQGYPRVHRLCLLHQGTHDLAQECTQVYWRDPRATSRCTACVRCTRGTHDLAQESTQVQWRSSRATSGCTAQVLTTIPAPRAPWRPPMEGPSCEASEDAIRTISGLDIISPIMRPRSEAPRPWRARGASRHCPIGKPAGKAMPLVPGAGCGALPPSEAPVAAAADRVCAGWLLSPVRLLPRRCFGLWLAPLPLASWLVSVKHRTQVDREEVHPWYVQNQSQHASSKT